MVALVAGFIAAFIIRAESPVAVANPMPALSFVFIFLSLLPFWILIFALLGLYNSQIHEKRFAELGRLFVGSFIGLMFMVFWDYMSLDYIFPAKLVPIYGFIIAFILLVSIRNLMRIIRTTLFSVGSGLHNIVIVGNTPMTVELIDTLVDSKKSGYKILGVVGYRKSLGHRLKSFPTFSQFLSSAPHELHSIIQTELYSNEQKNAEILTYAQENHIGYRFVPGNSELFTGNIDVALFRNSIPVIHVHHTALFGWGRIVKRLLDIVLGGILLLLSLPFWIVSIILLKLSEPDGPIFYKATRLSRFNSKVKVYKFRTMRQAYNNMTPEVAFTRMGKPHLIKQYRKHGDQLPNDPRISRVGRFLRASSLDELPQLWNVVHGELSLVGPRALDSYELERYDKKNLILSVKSGLTGLAIVSGRNTLTFEERRKLDLYYVQNWSVALDFIILLKTIRVVIDRLVHRGRR